MIVWPDKDSATNYSAPDKGISRLPINKSIKLNFERIYKFLVTPLRGIILHHELNIPYNDYERMCDACYEKYYCCYGGSHGCDVFDIKSMSLSIEEITHALDRYPSWHIMYVLNTATYASHQGIHWVMLELEKSYAKLICSQGSDFHCFRDNSKLYNSLINLNYRCLHNSTTIQHDGHSCGVFSSTCMLVMTLNNFDIKLTVQNIGKNGENLHGTHAPKVKVDIHLMRKNLFGNK